MYFFTLSFPLNVFVCIFCSPLSDCESSVASCTELIAALEALTVELQENGNRPTESLGGNPSGDLEEGEEGISFASEDETITRTNSGVSAGMEEVRARMSPFKSIPAVDSITRMHVAEKEKILLECKNQIKVNL